MYTPKTMVFIAVMSTLIYPHSSPLTICSQKILQFRALLPKKLTHIAMMLTSFSVFANNSEKISIFAPHCASLLHNFGSIKCWFLVCNNFCNTQEVSWYQRNP